jgi:hypothetical protein
MPDDDKPPSLPMRRITREALEAELVAIRNAAGAMLGESVEARPAIEADHRAVWHAAEVALAMLSPGYVPKREAVRDVRRMLAWYDDEDDAWRRLD